MTKYNGRFANCCTQNTTSLFMPEGSINRMSVKYQTFILWFHPLMNKFDTFFFHWQHHRQSSFFCSFFDSQQSNGERKTKADWSLFTWNNCLIVYDHHSYDQNQLKYEHVFMDDVRPPRLMIWWRDWFI